MKQARLEQARELLASGHLEKAKLAAQRAVQASPADPAAALLLCEILYTAGQAAQARHYASKAADLCRNDTAGLLAAAQFLSLVGAHEAAEKAQRRAIELTPMDAAPHAALIAGLSERRRFVDAERVCRDALAAIPGDLSLESLLAGALLNQSRAREAADLLADLARRFPGNAAVAGGLALVLNYPSGVSREEHFAAHRRFGQIIEAQPPVAVLPPRPATGPERRLRVGLISPDLRRHSVASFIEPLLQHADRERLEFVVYYTNAVADEVTARLRPLAALWHGAERATDEQLALQVRADGVDILLELSGHTHGGCLPVLNARPASLQGSYCGYPNTTGLGRADLRLVDSLTDPPGAESFSTERLVRIDPCFLCYTPPAESPEPRLPEPGRPITFGSFNAAQKLSDDTVSLWARVLAACPGARLLLKAVNFADAGVRHIVAGRFARAGVSPDRLELRAPTADQRDHLAGYHDVDIALDPTPYAGTTTTCEALWMGVPVVTLAGDRHAARVGVSLLHAAGAPELIAQSSDAFVAISARLVADEAARAAYRATLRDRLRQGVLCDGPAFARRFEAALRSVWRSHCTA